MVLHIRVHALDLAIDHEWNAIQMREKLHFLVVIVN